MKNADLPTEGNIAPDFCLPCAEGTPRKLSDFRGTKVMLCFYRYTQCPFTACAMKKLMGAHKKLAWAAKLKVITVFLTDEQLLQAGITNPKLPIQTIWRKDGNDTSNFSYPFLALADSDRSVYKLYQVKTMNFFKLNLWACAHLRDFFHPVNVSSWAQRAPKEAIKYGGLTSLHSEFLIDEDGRVVDVFRAKKPDQSMDIERIRFFLLHGQKCQP